MFASAQSVPLCRMSKLVQYFWDHVWSHCSHCWCCRTFQQPRETHESALSNTTCFKHCLWMAVEIKHFEIRWFLLLQPVSQMLKKKAEYLLVLSSVCQLVRKTAWPIWMARCTVLLSSLFVHFPSLPLCTVQVVCSWVLLGLFELL